MSPALALGTVSAVAVLYVVGYLLFAKPRGNSQGSAGIDNCLVTGLVVFLMSLILLAIPPSDEAVLRRFHEISYHNPRGWPSARWLGVATVQNPNDVWIHQEIISEIKPDFIVEAGTFLGGSAAIWAMVLAQVNPDGRVITIDIEDQVTAAKELPIVKQKVDFLVGSSTDPTIVGEVERRVKGKKVMVILDSDHRKEHVLAELRAYSRFVSIGSYLIVQDTNVNGHPVLKNFGPGPWEAVEDFLKETDHYVIDREREKLLFTMHPGGYLKRVK
jgi:cephalosporin hydroxylase